MLQEARAQELAEQQRAKTALMTERRREIAAAIPQTEKLLARLKEAVKSDNGKVFAEFRGPHIYSARDEHRSRESTTERAFRVLSLTTEKEISLSEATKLVGDALKLDGR